mgnify:FL=1
MVKKKEVNAIKTPPTHRKCIFTGEKQPKSHLVRFVVGPDKVLVPDVLGRLPGRGIWLKASRHVLFEACEKDVFSRAAKTSVTVPEDLTDLVEKLLKKHCLDILSIAYGAGEIIGGHEKVKSSLLIKKVGVLILASDAAAGSHSKIAQFIDNKPIINCFLGDELGRVTGRKRLVYAVIKPGGFAKKLLIETSRLLGFEENVSI